ncbi:endonuclease/exonuclease/phosphatase family protein [Pseudosulfitobacter koreensis]|uniref:Endonuclease/exonuclease/phosphatase family protein n=1 Tax=Pseudosulfitobacter koreensis TaxID=2968472 RepID=A0ABT1Z1Z2_9RHOB|nr:endonuclease/exonuclease/phosphatase family protein [Pseudosulfitobacter koreense]MCR8827138.1 endonuclease/exonuclease/phosphatase family protein [Pseudosulfitobacter koreense]
MRLATYNVEWFNALFDDDGTPMTDDTPSARYGITCARQTGALGTVFTALDADAVMIIEAPDHNRRRDTVRALENFAHLFDLRARRAVTGFVNDTQQEIALLYDPDMLSATHDPVGHPTGKKGAPDGPRFDGTFRIDLDVDNTQDLIRFSKPPLELAMRSHATDFAFRIIGAHLKSKAPHGATTRDQIMRHSIANRRKQLAQAIWLRARITDHLATGTPLIVMGDMNDGPGLDEYEHLFGRSSVEILLGGAGQEPMYDPHARLALSRRLGVMPTTARFWIVPEKRYLQALLDYIMISPDLRSRAPSWRIWHPLDDPDCWQVPQLRDALVTASDHFPVTLDIEM